MLLKLSFLVATSYALAVDKLVGFRQSPIDLPTSGFDEDHIILDDAEFDLEYGKVSLSDKHGEHFTLDGGHYQSDLTKLWYPNHTFSFTPDHFHFHLDDGVQSAKKDGSEHAIDGQHFDMEMHVVNLNGDNATKDLFLAGVIGILFKIEDYKEPTWVDDFFVTLMSDKIQDFGKDFMDHLNFNSRWVYKGSLTTPPYAETLFWTVLSDVVPISR